MNVLNIAFLEFENQRKIRNIITLHSNWSDYEERKRELRKLNLSSEEYENAVRIINDELSL